MSDLRKQPLIISSVVPTASRNGTVYLCVNVNTRSLYSMILRDFELEQNKNFYIVDKEGYVVFHRDSEYLFVKQDELPQKDDVIRSEAYSSILGLSLIHIERVVFVDVPAPAPHDIVVRLAEQRKRLFIPLRVPAVERVQRH